MLVLLVIIISCDDAFDPFGEFNEEYALVCVLRDDTNYQVAVLSTSYPPNEQGNENHFIEGADVRVWIGDSVYVFKDTTESSSSGNSLYYYSNNFRVAPNKMIEIEALLPNGRRLKSISKSPSEIEFLRESSTTVPVSNSDLVKLYWELQGLGNYFLPKLEIKYLYNGEIHYKEVPVRYDNVEGTSLPVYPIASNRNNIIYNLDAINKTMDLISEGDPDKNSYSVYQSLNFSVIVFDKEVTRYISTTSQTKIDLTITLNLPDYSNISGGLGVFGSMLIANYENLIFIPDFVSGFGYKIILN